jgi:CelD/BcsL family acetyltransferase involved in cellulose biosynthesis
VFPAIPLDRPLAVVSGRRRVRYGPVVKPAGTPPASAPVSSSDLTVVAHTSADALGRLGPEWQRLPAAHREGLPFRTWEWHVAWWRHLRQERALAHDQLFVHAVRDRAGALVAVAPMMLTRRLGPRPLGVRVIEFIGADHNVTEIRGVVCDPLHEAATYEALRSHLDGSARRWDWIHWRGLTAGGEAHRIIEATPRARLTHAVPSFVLKLPPTWSEFRSSRSRNVKESIRKCYNSLRRHGHAFALEVASTPGDVAAALPDFFRLHRARAELRDRVHHPDLFRSRAARDFLQDACSLLAARGMVRIFRLRVQGAVVAVRVGFAIGETLYLYYSGYDPRWSSCSVMTTTVAEAIRYGIEARFRSVNLSTGRDVSKTRWGPEEVMRVDASHPSPCLRGSLAHGAYHGVRDRLYRHATARLRNAILRVAGRGAQRA